LKGALRVSEHHLKDANERLERLSIKTKENAQEALKASDKAIEKLTRMNNELKTELNIFKKMLWRFYWRG
jgi:ribosome-associated translation inhibitor RaiA